MMMLTVPTEEGNEGKEERVSGEKAFFQVTRKGGGDNCAKPPGRACRAQAAAQRPRQAAGSLGAKGKNGARRQRLRAQEPSPAGRGLKAKEGSSPLRWVVWKDHSSGYLQSQLQDGSSTS